MARVEARFAKASERKGGRFVHNDRESRGRRLLMNIIGGIERRLRAGRRADDIDWEQVRRRMRVADPNFSDSAERVRELMLEVIMDR